MNEGQFECISCRLRFVPHCKPCREAPRTRCPKCGALAEKVRVVEVPPESIGTSRLQQQIEEINELTVQRTMPTVLRRFTGQE